LDSSSRIDYAPTLPVNQYVRETFGGADQNPFDLLRRQIRIRFQHLRDNRRNNGRGKRGPVNILVMLGNDLFMPQAESDNLANRMTRPIQRGIEFWVNTRIVFDDLVQITI
jgi:hypothetical protein